MVPSVGAAWPEQNAPKQNNHPAVWDLVLSDLEKISFDNLHQASVHKLFVQDIRLRDLSGEKKYGVRLQPFNDRLAIQDAYEEFLDAIVYTRQAIFENQTILVQTEASEFMGRGLNRCYNSALNSALMLKFILEKNKTTKE